MPYQLSQDDQLLAATLARDQIQRELEANAQRQDGRPPEQPLGDGLDPIRIGPEPPSLAPEGQGAQQHLAEIRETDAERAEAIVELSVAAIQLVQSFLDAAEISTPAGAVSWAAEHLSNIMDIASGSTEVSGAKLNDGQKVALDGTTFLVACGAFLLLPEVTAFGLLLGGAELFAQASKLGPEIHSVLHPDTPFPYGPAEWPGPGGWGGSPNLSQPDGSQVFSPPPGGPVAPDGNMAGGGQGFAPPLDPNPPNLSQPDGSQVFSPPPPDPNPPNLSQPDGTQGFAPAPSSPEAVQAPSPSSSPQDGQQPAHTDTDQGALQQGATNFTPVDDSASAAAQPAPEVQPTSLESDSQGILSGLGDEEVRPLDAQNPGWGPLALFDPQGGFSAMANPFDPQMVAMPDHSAVPGPFDPQMPGVPDHFAIPDPFDGQAWAMPDHSITPGGFDGGTMSAPDMAGMGNPFDPAMFGPGDHSSIDHGVIDPFDPSLSGSGGPHDAGGTPPHDGGMPNPFDLTMNPDSASALNPFDLASSASPDPSALSSDSLLQLHGPVDQVPDLLDPFAGAMAPENNPAPQDGTGEAAAGISAPLETTSPLDPSASGIGNTAPEHSPNQPQSPDDQNSSQASMYPGSQDQNQQIDASSNQPVSVDFQPAPVENVEAASNGGAADVDVYAVH